MLSSFVFHNLRELEVALFEIVTIRLRERYGDEWWHEGVPEGLRTKAAERQEKDRGQAPKERYLDLSDLIRTLEQKWPLFRDLLDPSKAGKSKALEWTNRVLKLRNRVMHPVRGDSLPATEEESNFVANKCEELRRITAALRGSSEADG